MAFHAPVVTMVLAANESISHIHSSGFKLLILAIAVFAVEGLVVLHRVYGGLPADLDRVGSELNLFAYGTAVCLLVGIFLDVLMLPGFPSKNSGIFYVIVFVFTIYNLYAYGFNAKLSEHFRSLPDLEGGIQNLQDFKCVLRDPRRLFLLLFSWAVGLIPTIACLAAQIFWG